MKYLIIFCLVFVCLQSIGAQGVNCDAVYEKATPCYDACKLIYGEPKGSRVDFQGTKESQANCDSAIQLCPTFAEAYYVKAIPYLKRGEFIVWKELIDKAVQYDTLAYLGYRGGARFMFLRDYEGAIYDIELLKKYSRSDDLGTIYNGDYNLEIIRALSYRGIGDTVRAVQILKDYFVAKDDPGFYGLYHLGVMLYQLNQLEEAENVLKKQIEVYDMADVYYYLAMVYKKEGHKSDFMAMMKKAHQNYVAGRTIRGLDSYMDYPDKIYLKQIELELENQ